MFFYKFGILSRVHFPLQEFLAIHFNNVHQINHLEESNESVRLFLLK